MVEHRAIGVAYLSLPEQGFRPVQVLQRLLSAHLLRSS